MTRRNQKYPSVRKNCVKGRIYWKFEKNGFRCNLPGPYGSPDFISAYEAALNQVRLPKTSAQVDTVGWLIEQFWEAFLTGPHRKSAKRRWGINSAGSGSKQVTSRTPG